MSTTSSHTFSPTIKSGYHKKSRRKTVPRAGNSNTKSNESTIKSSAVKTRLSQTRPTDKEYRLAVKTVSVDSVTQAIEAIIQQLHEHEIPNRKFIPDQSGEMAMMKTLMGKDADSFDRSIRKLKTRLFHLERWSELEPKYTFRAIDNAHKTVDEYTVTFQNKDSDSEYTDTHKPVDSKNNLTMVVDITHKSLESTTPVTYQSHIIDLRTQQSAFKQHLAKAFNIIGVAVLIELMII